MGITIELSYILNLSLFKTHWKLAINANQSSAMKWMNGIKRVLYQHKVLFQKRQENVRTEGSKEINGRNFINSSFSRILKITFLPIVFYGMKILGMSFSQRYHIHHLPCISNYCIENDTLFATTIDVNLYWKSHLHSHCSGVQCAICIRHLHPKQNSVSIFNKMKC